MISELVAMGRCISLAVLFLVTLRQDHLPADALSPDKAQGIDSTSIFLWAEDEAPPRQRRGANEMAIYSQRIENPAGTALEFTASGRRTSESASLASIQAPNRECPYIIQSEDEAHVRATNTSIPGNMVMIEHLRFCRTGNHFSIVFRNLALGYCCKSKLVWLPPKDDILAPGIFNEGTPGPRWFDFSTAPDVKGFESLSCKAHITWAGQRAFRMDQLDTPNHSHYTPMLRECIKEAPRLLGCESAYYFPTDEDVCPDKEAAKREGGAGTLVLHVRSGDIFGDAILWYYGQPPLQFYLHVIQHQKWDRIEVVTNGEDSWTLNPVIPALQAKIDSGELPENIQIHTNRSMEEDLRSMMCADGLGIARSTLSPLTTYHSTATRIYGPFECNQQLKQLSTFRPEAQVYGLSWPRQYSVYENWENTPYQRKEMVEYSNITGLTQCTG